MTDAQLASVCIPVCRELHLNDIKRLFLLCRGWCREPRHQIGSSCILVDNNLFSLRLCINNLHAAFNDLSNDNLNALIFRVNMLIRLAPATVEQRIARRHTRRFRRLLARCDTE